MKKDIVEFTDFTKLDMRVGEVITAVNLEKSNKLIKLTVNLGEEYGTRTILTGMRKWYKPEDFIGKKFLFLANLAPRPMAGSESQGMIISADVNDEPKLIEITNELENGTEIK